MTENWGTTGTPEEPGKTETPGDATETPSQGGTQGYSEYPPQTYSPYPPQSYSPQYQSAYPPPPGAYPGSYPPAPGAYPGGYPPPPPYGGYGFPPAQPRNGLGTGALIAGLLSVPAAFTVIGGVLLGVLGVILGLVGYSRAKRGEATNGGIAIAGAVLGALGAILSIVLAITIWGVFKEYGGHDFVDCVQRAGNDRAAVQLCEDEFRGNLENRLSITITPAPVP